MSDISASLAHYILEEERLLESIVPLYFDASNKVKATDWEFICFEMTAAAEAQGLPKREYSKSGLMYKWYRMDKKKEQEVAALAAPQKAAQTNSNAYLPYTLAEERLLESIVPRYYDSSNRDSNKLRDKGWDNICVEMTAAAEAQGFPKREYSKAGLFSKWLRMVIKKEREAARTAAQMTAQTAG